jgi:hypothetical protein
MNQRISKQLRKAVAARTDMPPEEKGQYYRMVKRDYSQYRFLHSQQPKLNSSRRQKRLARKIQKAKEDAAA